MRPSLDMRCPSHRTQVVRLTSRKVDIGRISRGNLMGPLTNSHARARMSGAQDRSFPRLLDASSAPTPVRTNQVTTTTPSDSAKKAGDNEGHPINLQ